MKKESIYPSLPTSQELEQELNRVKARDRGMTVLQILAAILVSGIILGLLITQMSTVRIMGNSMNPTLS